jgi:hypothetical protein
VFVTKEYDAARPGLAQVTQGNGLLIQLDPDDGCTCASLALDPTDLGVHPVETGSHGKRVALVERLVVVVGIGNRHTGPDGIASPKERSKVGREGHPEWGDEQMVRAWKGSSSSLEVVC